MQITQVKRVSIPVSDQDRAKDFYVNALDFELVTEQPMPMGENTRWIEVAPDGAATSLILGNWFPTMRPGSVTGLMLETTDITTDCERLRSHGVDVDGPNESPWGRQATFADPDGNGFVLAEPPAGA